MAETIAAHTASNKEGSKTGIQKSALGTQRRIRSWAKDYSALIGIIGVGVAIIGLGAYFQDKMEQRLESKVDTVESSLIKTVDGYKSVMSDIESDMQSLSIAMLNYHTEQAGAIREIRGYLFDHQAQHDP